MSAIIRSLSQRHPLAWLTVFLSALGLGAVFWFASRAPGAAATGGALVFRAGTVVNPARPPAVQLGLFADPVPALGPGPLTGEDTADLGDIEAWSRGAWAQVRPRSLVPAEVERVELVKALEATALYAFVTNHPGSAWTPGLAARLGIHFRHAGEYSKALDLLEGAWGLLGPAESGPARALADEVLGEYVGLLSRVGRLETLSAVLDATEGRVIREEAAAARHALALEARNHMRRNPGKSYRCGTFALGHLAAAWQGGWEPLRALREIPSPAEGFSLGDLRRFAGEQRLDVAVVRWAAPHELVVPSVVHWQAGHYAALVSREGGWVQVVDPTFGGPVLLREDAVRAEASGYFVVPRPLVPAGWAEVDAGTAAQVWGRGYYTAVGDGHDEPTCPPPGKGPGTPGSPGGPGGPGGDGFKATAGKSGGCCGMPQWQVSEPNVNVWLFDTPLAYQPSRGPEVGVNLAYRQRHAAYPYPLTARNFTSVGVLWRLTGRGLVSALGGTLDALHSATVYTEAGAELRFDFGTNALVSARNYFLNATLEILVDAQTNQTGFKLRYPDGATQTYGLVVTNTSGTVYCWALTASKDAHGIGQTISYRPYDPDDGVCILIDQVTDVDGHALSFTYATLGDPSTATPTSSRRSRTGRGAAPSFPTTPTRLI
jgi:hypothetical protein